tara:strand:+ start:404 stop:1429 length:1026 start_codon:yes stop_codon:yes gene_type:complete
MAFKNLKNHISSLAQPFIANAIANFGVKESAANAGKIAAKLANKSPFEIDEAPAQKLLSNKLKFSPVQYPLDLGSNELGHYMIFEAGFLKYSPQTSNFINKSIKPGSQGFRSKMPDGKISNSAIALYMPPTISVSYGQEYAPETAGIAGAGEDAIKAYESAEEGEKLVAALKTGGSFAVTKVSEIVGQVVSMTGAGDPIKLIQKRRGIAINPRNEQFYDSPKFRSFSYTFDFWPRNPKEAKAVEDIIYIFKYNSSPGISGDLGTGFFEQPNYFNISYMYNGEKNSHLNQISACYCTDVEVDYSPDGQATFFEGTGIPVHTKLTVQFIEDRILTKQDIVDGA